MSFVDDLQDISSKTIDIIERHDELKSSVEKAVAILTTLSIKMYQDEERADDPHYSSDCIDLAIALIDPPPEKMTLRESVKLYDFFLNLREKTSPKEVNND